MGFIKGVAAIALALALGSMAEARPSPEEVLRLDTRLALELTRHTPTTSPPVASRAFAYLYVTAYEAVAGDSAEELLGQIEVRTLLIAGERDQFTPRRIMELMEARIPAAQLKVYERATHYLPMEFPSRLAADMRDFMNEDGSAAPD